MSYRITIIKTEPNPNFAAEVEAYNQKRPNYGMNKYEMERDPSYPQEEIRKNALLTELTDEQFVTVQLEILKAFK